MTASNLNANDMRALGVDTLCVKWKTPAEELVGIAALAHELLTRGEVRTDRLCLAVPNRNWAVQAQRACARIGLETAVCIAPARWDAATHRSLAALELLARPGEKAQAAWKAAGGTLEEARRIVRTCGEARGFTLARMTGLEEAPACAHALRHLGGEEDACELSALVLEQLTRPSLPARSSCVPIVDVRAIQSTYDWVFLIGCVDGLIPAAQAFEAVDEQKRIEALEVDRRAFFSAINHASVRAVVSSFTEIDAEVARQAHIRPARFKMHHATRMALTAPSMLLEETGAERPSTMGGQALLREYNLN